MQTLLRLLVSLVVFINLTGAIVCLDSQCAEEKSSCRSHHEDEVTTSEADHPVESDHAPQEHCSACPQCTASVIMINTVEMQYFSGCALPERIVIEELHTGWTSLPDRPPTV